ncbi:Atu4866 domain-containing protein [Streptomyces sp. NPDC058623]|uniref:Atu4866 domain-containing protein n=1 Tax=Streptomyces sp. NPDC058623 TaxID=3346563 RepID=UPI0036522FAB
MKDSRTHEAHHQEPQADEQADVVGMWVTADGHIRQELCADGRYDEARGTRRSAYTGRWTATGNHIDHVDDTGFTATGDIRDGVLFHKHLVLHKEAPQA